MGKSTKSRKIKTPAELQIEVEGRMRLALIGSGIPEHRVAGEKVHDFTHQSNPNMKGYSVIRSLYSTTVDRWLADGGPGFEEPQRRAIDRVRSLWHVSGCCGKLVANLDGVGGGGGGFERGIAQAEALAAVQGYKDKLGLPWAWDVFENVVRHDMTAEQAGEALARNNSQRRAHAKAYVGLIASKIAEWERF